MRREIAIVLDAQPNVYLCKKRGAEVKLETMQSFLFAVIVIIGMTTLSAVAADPQSQFGPSNPNCDCGSAIAVRAEQPVLRA